MPKSVGSQSQPVDQMLSQTGMGSYIAKHKNLSIAAVILVILAVVFYGVYRNKQNEKMNVYSGEAFSFSKKHFKDLTDKKIKGKVYLEKFKVLFEDSEGFKGFFPLGIKSVDILLDQKDNESALELLILLKNSFFKSGDLMKYFIGVRMATAYENLKTPRKSIEVLEELNKSSLKLLENKLYLDLGRLYKNVGDTVKAKANLQYVVDNAPENDTKKMARLYLSDL